MDANTALGRLLLSQSGATRLSSMYSVVVTALCWGLASLSWLMRLPGVPYILIATGALPLMTILWRRTKSISVYERGVIVRKLLKSQTILHSDVAGLEFLAAPDHRFSIYGGTTTHLEIIPRFENSVKIRIWGSMEDSFRIGSIVQLILTANPDAQLLKIRGVDDFK